MSLNVVIWPTEKETYEIEKANEDNNENHASHACPSRGEHEGLSVLLLKKRKRNPVPQFKPFARISWVMVEYIPCRILNSVGMSSTHLNLGVILTFWRSPYAANGRHSFPSAKDSQQYQRTPNVHRRRGRSGVRMTRQVIPRKVPHLSFLWQMSCMLLDVQQAVCICLMCKHFKVVS